MRDIGATDGEIAVRDAVASGASPRRSDGRSAAMERALQGSPVMLFELDETLRYRWLTNLHSPWSQQQLVGRTDAEALGTDVAGPLTEAAERVLRTGEPCRMEFDLELHRQRHWFDISLRRDMDEDGRTVILGSALDVSEKKRREIMLHALLREVAHRSKNLLSMVLSIASQTSRKASDKDTFLRRFSGRIQSIARSQDAITRSDWRGALFSELVDSEIIGSMDGRRGRITRSGPDLQLNPNAALHVGLALHELVTNALDHGALSLARGSVTITVEAEGAGARILWDERGSETPGSISVESFGMTTLKRIVHVSVDGEASLQLRDDGLLYTLTVGLGHCEVVG